MAYPDRVLTWAIRAFLLIFFTYLLFPLVYLLLLAFNDSRIPTHKDFTFTLKWFGEAWGNERLWEGLETSLMIGAVVVAISLTLGMGGAMLLVRLQLRAKNLIYAVLVSPILAPGIVLGISTFIFWSQQLGVRPSWWTAALAQSSF
ncbi:MAG: ABC transporter permease, partial [Alphaproteobacteria bacterium]|nr:ABC transporter permease [Alphaproteobacteria bacterium]